MDPRFRGFSTARNGIQLEFNPDSSCLPDNNLIGGPRFQTPLSNNSFGGFSIIPDNPVNPFPNPRFQSVFADHGSSFTSYEFGIPFHSNDDAPTNNLVSTSTLTYEEDPHEDCDFSDAVLQYINQILMEEDMEEKTCMLQESLDLQAAEKSFYDVIGKKYPPSPQIDRANNNVEISDEYNYVYSGSNSSSNNGPRSSVTSSNSANNGVIDGCFLDSPISPLQISDLYGGNQSVWQFNKGVEEANKFLPKSSELLINFAANKTPVKEEDSSSPFSPKELKGRKNPYREEECDLEEERSSKQAAVFPDATVRSEMFDKVLLCSMGSGEIALKEYREELKNEIDKRTQQNSTTSMSNKGRGKKQVVKKEVIDLRNLLIHCAQAVAADDQRCANELLKQIRQHSSPFGDGNQRLAHCLADGLEARLAGTGSQIYKAFLSRKTSAVDYLKAYHLYLASCPFRKMSNFTSNKTIMLNAEKSTRLHVIDFGILYGFQWPTLIQRIAQREGGPPKLRITGIEFPQPGFRPAAGVEETGRRLKDYAKTFDVPFEYNAIAKNWDSITIQDLKLDDDEYVVVNCLYRSKNLHDETVLADSSRNIVLNLIRKINPNLFIHGVLNGSYNAPFFVTRFREALFHYSALFDMLETNVPREYHERMLIEREVFGKEALNVIACEGWERVERPETYKQWQVRNMRAGFAQVPFNRDIVEKAVWKVRTSYHKDFVIDEDSMWLLQGWKGRIIYALSCWKPV
ncbi:scarecrow-like protein 9 [Impatiens glandulifera]|uniref:scarecrow-like protein 9 n=1 Tax=Impatiens glandulifera TaxID=253017 RepID=UPI001FB131C1|nr:scarecrow-like protein 9 [Impatiens glandulifera]